MSAKVKEPNLIDKLSDRGMNAYILAVESYANGNYDHTIAGLTIYKEVVKTLGIYIDKTTLSSMQNSNTDKILDDMMQVSCEVSARRILETARKRQAVNFNNQNVKMFSGDVVKLGELCRLGKFDLPRVRSSFDEINQLTGRGDAQRFFGPQIGLPSV